MYRSVLKDAELDPKEWVPRETRHTFVSIMSDNGAPDEVIADLVGHAKTSTTRTVYRHRLRPVIATGADITERAFKEKQPSRNPGEGDAPTGRGPLSGSLASI